MFGIMHAPARSGVSKPRGSYTNRPRGGPPRVRDLSSSLSSRSHAVLLSAICRDLFETHKEPCRGLPVAVGCDQGIQAVVYCSDIGHI